MSPSCNDIRARLAELITAGLTDEEHLTVERHLADCPACRAHQRALLGDHRLLARFVESMDDGIAALANRIVERVDDDGAAPTAEAAAAGAASASTVPLPADEWHPGSWLRYAVLAAAAIVVVLSLQILDGPTTEPVAWAEVIAQVAEAKDFICRMRTASNYLEDGPIETVRYKSAEFGTRDDRYQDGKLVTRTYWVPSTLEEIALHVYDDAYMITRHSREEFELRSSHGDAQEMVDFFRSYPYRELGTRRVDGVLAAGIELEDPEFMAGAFDSARLRLWIDTETNWPVKLEMSYRADAGRLRADIDMYDFQWNPVLPASEVQPDIPDHFQLALVLDAPVADEEHAIRGLRGLAEVTRGRYPSSLTWGSAAGQAIRDIRRQGPPGSGRVRAVENLMGIRSAIAFYVELEKADRDVVYYGDRVTSRDFDRILMRWRNDDSTYRVIYGDLRAETVSAARLEELEARR